MDVTRRRFLALGAAAVTVPLVARKPPPPPPASSGWRLSSQPGRAAPGAFWPGGAA